MFDKIKNNFNIIMKWGNILFLFLFSLHFNDFSSKVVILWCAFSIITYWIKNKKICLDKMFWILSMAIILNGLGTKYYIGDSLGYTWKDIIKMVVPTIIVYPFIKQLVSDKKQFDIKIIISVIILGTFIYSLLNYYAFLKYGFAANGRIWNEYWTNYSMNATHHSYWGCFIVGLSGFGMYCLMKRKWIQGSIIILLIIIENYIHIAVDSRMVLCITAVALMTFILLFLILNRKDKNKIKKSLIYLFLVICFLAIIYTVDFCGIRSNGYMQRFVTKDGGILGNIRFQMIFEAIKMLPSHWKGGADMCVAGLYIVHNYWLQVANVSGIIPFILWMIVNVSTIRDFIRLIRSELISEEVKYMLLPVIISVFSYLMMEPGGTESNRYIIFYIMLIAILKQLANKEITEGVK